MKSADLLPAFQASSIDHAKVVDIEKLTNYLERAAHNMPGHWVGILK